MIRQVRASRKAQPTGYPKIDRSWMRPTSLWAFCGSPFPYDFSGNGRHLTIAGGGAVRTVGSQGVGSKTGGYMNADSGWYCPATTTGVEFLSELTMFGVVEFSSISSGAECSIYRADTYSTNQLALDVFPASGVVRPLITTSGATGWTIYVDTTVGFQANTPVLVIARWKSGSPVQVSATPIGSESVKWVQNSYSVSGSITTNGNVSPHFGGMAPGNSADFPGMVYMVGVLPYSISDADARRLAKRPWEVFSPITTYEPMQLAGATLTPYRALYWDGVTIAHVPTAQLGTGKKPLVMMIDGTLKERAASEGVPVIIDNGIMRCLNTATESLEV